jgi:hypothetical protein
MNRRDFLKQSTVLTGATGLGISTAPAFAQASPEIIRVGHLVGICMSPLF